LPAPVCSNAVILLALMMIVSLPKPALKTSMPPLPGVMLKGIQRGFVINGESKDDFSALPVSSAGDVNGDGLDDLIIGAINNKAA
jgi:hypothetical protein